MGDRDYGLSSLSEKERKKESLTVVHVFTKAALSAQFINDPGCWSDRGFNQQPPARQTGASLTELTGR